MPWRGAWLQPCSHEPLCRGSLLIQVDLELVRSSTGAPEGRPLGAGGCGALCLSCPSVLENADADPVPAPQLLRQSRLFMNEARAGEGGLVLLRQSVGWVMRFIHAQPSSPRCILKDIVHFLSIQIRFFSPPPHATVHKLGH